MWLGGSLIHIQTPYSGDGLPAATHTRQGEFHSSVTTNFIKDLIPLLEKIQQMNNAGFSFSTNLKRSEHQALIYTSIR